MYQDTGWPKKKYHAVVSWSFRSGFVIWPLHNVCHSYCIMTSSYNDKVKAIQSLT